MTTVSTPQYDPRIARRFRRFLPVVVDIETGGFNAATDAILEIAIVTIGLDKTGQLCPHPVHFQHVLPFAGARLDPKALDFNGIHDPYHPFRQAVSEQEALSRIFAHIKTALQASHCERAIMVAHNAIFDMSFLNAAIMRTMITNSPFHAFSCFDTVSLAGLAVGQTVLARAVRACGLAWDNAEAHSAIYDAERTAALFCHIVNQWDRLTTAKQLQPIA